MYYYTAEHIKELCELISTSTFDQLDPGPEVICITLWNNKEVICSNYGGDKKPDIKVETETIADHETLGYFVSRLVHDDESFVTQTRDGDVVKTLIWEIKNKQ